MTETKPISGQHDAPSEQDGKVPSLALYDSYSAAALGMAEFDVRWFKEHPNEPQMFRELVIGESPAADSFRGRKGQQFWALVVRNDDRGPWFREIYPVIEVGNARLFLSSAAEPLSNAIPFANVFDGTAGFAGGTTGAVQ